MDPAHYAERAVAAADPPKPRIVKRLEAQRARHRDRPLAVRGLYVAVGFTLLAAGAAMLILPGPAFVVIPVVPGVGAQGPRAPDDDDRARHHRPRRPLAVAALVVWGLLGDIPLLPM